MSKASKAKHFPLKTRAPLFDYHPRREKFGGPSAYEVKEQPSVKSFVISHAPRFEHERQQIVEEQRRKREEALQQKLANASATTTPVPILKSNGGGSSKKTTRSPTRLYEPIRSNSPKPEDIDRTPQHLMFKAVEVPARAPNFSTSKEPRFDWQKIEELRFEREKRKQALVERAKSAEFNNGGAGLAAKAVKTKASKNNTGNKQHHKNKRKAVAQHRYLEQPPPEIFYRVPQPSELDVERALKSVEPRPVVPIIRPETEKDKVFGGIHHNKVQNKPLTDEEIRSIAAAQEHGTIAHSVRTCRIGDFGKGAERVFLPPEAARSPGSIYEPRLEAIEPHKQVPIIAPAPQQNLKDAEEHRKRGEAAMEMLHSSSPKRFKATAQLTEQDIAETSVRAMQQLDKIRPRAPAAILDLKQPISAAMPFSFDVANYNNSRSMRALLCDTEGIRVNCEAIAAAAASTTPTKVSPKKRRPKQKQQQDEQQTPALQRSEAQQQQNDSSRNQSRLSHHSAVSSSSAAATAALMEAGIQSPFCRRSPGPLTKFSLKTPTLEGVIVPADEANRRALLKSEGRSMSALSFRRDGLVRVASAAVGGDDDDNSPGENEDRWRAVHQRIAATTPEPAVVLHPNRWSVAVRAKALPASGIPLAALLRKKKAEQSEVFRSLYKEMGGPSAARLRQLQKQSQMM